VKRTGLITVAAVSALLLAGVGRADRALAAPAALPSGVTIAGVPVGGLRPAAAYSAVRAAFAVPVSLVLNDRMTLVAPARLGAVAYAKSAVSAAVAAAPGARVPLRVEVRQGPLRSYLAGVAARTDRAPVDSLFELRNLHPLIHPGTPGVRLDRDAAAQAITRALLAGSRDPVFLPTRDVVPQVSATQFSGPVIVIRRASNVLQLFDGERLVRTFRVATGQPAYPTPLGRFTIIVRWKNPWWYPPNDPWAAGEKPTPPGPGNPLGTRWMGLSSPGVGIHGTPKDGSIGYSLSHGCIRMHIPDAEWLFERVEVGTPVYIVAA
jgi:lipoprotein-anchoring transpeptidase ErfK/SrfK